jgi:hypothetical protein
MTIREIQAEGSFMWPFDAAQRLMDRTLDIWAPRNWIDHRIAEAQLLGMAVAGGHVEAETIRWNKTVNAGMEVFSWNS